MSATLDAFILEVQRLDKQDKRRCGKIAAECLHCLSVVRQYAGLDPAHTDQLWFDNADRFRAAVARLEVLVNLPRGLTGLLQFILDQPPAFLATANYKIDRDAWKTHREEIADGCSF